MTNDQSSSNSFIPKFTQVLVVEKETRLEYLEKSNQLDNLDKKKRENITEDNNRHYTAHDLLVESLGSNQLDYVCIKDKEISEVDFEEFGVVITLGGDGTFINAAAKISHQILIGINSEPRKSIGGLARFVPSDIPDLCQKIATGNYNVQNWDRLSARINGKELPYWAINEILISKPNIYQTSKLHIKVGDKDGFCYGNGIIISTQRGSTAFYKSANGLPFEDRVFGSFGYALVLPFQIKGEIAISSILEPQDSINISPKRSGHSLIFDCDEKRIFKLNDEDEVEIFRDEQYVLRVLI